MRDREITTKIYVGDLLESVRKDELENAFKKYGRIKETWIAQNPPGFGFVEFQNREDAMRAVQGMDGRSVCGSRVRVELARKPRRTGGGGGGGPRIGNRVDRGRGAPVRSGPVRGGAAKAVRIGKVVRRPLPPTQKRSPPRRSSPQRRASPLLGRRLPSPHRRARSPLQMSQPALSLFASSRHLGSPIRGRPSSPPLRSIRDTLGSYDDILALDRYRELGLSASMRLREDRLRELYAVLPPGWDRGRTPPPLPPLPPLSSFRSRSPIPPRRRSPLPLSRRPRDEPMVARGARARSRSPLMRRTSPIRNRNMSPPVRSRGVKEMKSGVGPPRDRMRKPDGPRLVRPDGNRRPRRSRSPRPKGRP